MFVNTKIKCMNPNWERIDCVPVEISLRDRVGISVDKDKLENCDAIVKELLSRSDEYREIIAEVLQNHLYNIGTAGEAGADYILNSLVEKKRSK